MENSKTTYFASSLTRARHVGLQKSHSCLILKRLFRIALAEPVAVRLFDRRDQAAIVKPKPRLGHPSQRLGVPPEERINSRIW